MNTVEHIKGHRATLRIEKLHLGDIGACCNRKHDRLAVEDRRIADGKGCVKGSCFHRVTDGKPCVSPCCTDFCFQHPGILSQSAGRSGYDPSACSLGGVIDMDSVGQIVGHGVTQRVEELNLANTETCYRCKVNRASKQNCRCADVKGRRVGIVNDSQRFAHFHRFKGFAEVSRADNIIVLQKPDVDHPNLIGEIFAHGADGVVVRVITLNRNNLRA